MRYSSLIVAACLLVGLGCNKGSNPKIEIANPANPIDSLAILPFTGQIPKPTIATAATWPQTVRQFLEVVLPEMLTADITEKPAANSLRVIAAESVRERKFAARTAQEVGKELRVGAVLTGKTIDDQLLIQLIGVDSGELLWSHSYPLNFGFSEEYGTWRLSLLDSDREQIVSSVISKLTGEAPAFAKKAKSE
jgi:hypothetical protein